MAERIAKMLNVKPDEVAIIGILDALEAPALPGARIAEECRLYSLSSTSALAARTARESRPEINNNFAAVRHASVFEGVKVGGEADGSDSKNYQRADFVGRPGGRDHSNQPQGSCARRAAGPDFTAGDLGQVLALCKPLGKLLRHVAGSRTLNLPGIIFQEHCPESRAGLELR